VRKAPQVGLSSSEIFRAGDADIELGLAHVRVDRDFGIILRAHSSNFVLLRIHVCQLCHQVGALRQGSRESVHRPNRSFAPMSIFVRGRPRSVARLATVRCSPLRNSRVTLHPGRRFNVERRLRAFAVALGEARAWSRGRCRRGPAPLLPPFVQPPTRFG